MSTEKRDSITPRDNEELCHDRGMVDASDNKPVNFCTTQETACKVNSLESGLNPITLLRESASQEENDVVSLEPSQSPSSLILEPHSGSEEFLLVRPELRSPALVGRENTFCETLNLSPSTNMNVDLIQFEPLVSDHEENNVEMTVPQFYDNKDIVGNFIFQCDANMQDVTDDDEDDENADLETAPLSMGARIPETTSRRQNDDTHVCTQEEGQDLLLDFVMPKRFGLPQVKSAAEISVASSVSQKSLPICRICHLPANESETLISPCRCSGTMQFIHNSCLMRWLEISSKRSKRPPSCELCLYQYHRHKKFKVRHWQFPACSRRDKILHTIFIISLVTMIGCASATIMCFKNDKGVRNSLNKTELTKSEVVTLVCGVLFFIAFFVAMYVEVKSRNTIYKLMVTFLYLNQQWYIDEYDKKKDIQPVPV